MKRILSLGIALLMIMAMAASAQAAAIVQIDNEPKSRPQIGIGMADVIYEVELYNGGYTRYTAVFMNDYPEKLEAIRSARIPNADIAKEYGGLFIHYGGQNYEGRDVFKYMENLKDFDSLEGMRSGEFKRDSSRAAPNNVYVNLAKVMKSAKYTDNAHMPFSFSEDGFTSQGDDVTKFDIAYRGNDYHPSFEYNAKDGLYYRFYNGKAHVDGGSKEQLTFANVIVMRVETSWHNGMSDAPIIELTGSGVCEYFIDGKHFTGTWSRKNVNSNTVYNDADGNEVIFKTGKVMVELAKDRVELNY